MVRQYLRSGAVEGYNFSIPATRVRFRAVAGGGGGGGVLQDEGKIGSLLGNYNIDRGVCGSIGRY